MTNPGMILLFSFLSTLALAESENELVGDYYNRQDKKSPEGMKAIGSPLFYYIFFFCGVVCVFLANANLKDSLMKIRSNHHKALLAICVLIVISDIFLICSLANNYAALSLIVSLWVFASTRSLVIAPRTRNLNLLLGVLAYFLIVVGIPSKYSSGLMDQFVQSTCMKYYKTYQKYLCKSKYLTFLEFVGICHITFVFMMATLLLVVIYFPSSASTPSVANDGNGDNDGQQDGDQDETTSLVRSSAQHQKQKLVVPQKTGESNSITNGNNGDGNTE